MGWSGAISISSKVMKPKRCLYHSSTIRKSLTSSTTWLSRITVAGPATMRMVSLARMEQRYLRPGAHQPAGRPLSVCHHFDKSPVRVAGTPRPPPGSNGRPPRHRRRPVFANHGCLPRADRAANRLHPSGMPKGAGVARSNAFHHALPAVAPEGFREILHD